MNMKLAIYGHGGSENHGNEAIVRGVRNLFPNDEITLYSHHTNADIHFGLDEICKVKPMTGKCPLWICRLHDFLKKINVFCSLYYKYRFKPFLKDLDNETVYLLEAGDQYCEQNEHRRWYAYLNKKIKSVGAKTVMLGCTINPDILNDKKVIKDLNNYSAVIARESVTYNALIKAGVIAKLAPCPAFKMEKEIPIFDAQADIIERYNTVGFNIGFLQQGNEKYYDALYRNYKNAIQYLIDNTDYYIALIPHVNWNYCTTDYIALDKLYKEFKNYDRVYLVNEYNAPTQKYHISKCKLFISLRTHASISALSSGVPTIIAGYKIKSIGLANDIYEGKYDMLAEVQSLDGDFVIKNKIKNVLEHLEDIRVYQLDKMDKYFKKTEVIVDTINEIKK